jgi:hypothetical protein
MGPVARYMLRAALSENIGRHEKTRVEFAGYISVIDRGLYVYYSGPAVTVKVYKVALNFKRTLTADTIAAC